METIKIAALSVNRSYQGRRFSTPALKAYKEAVSWLLPPLKVPLNKKLSVKYEFGVSSKNADGDNLIKAFQDILCERYEFNDRQIYHWEVRKVDVRKGTEYIRFEITS